jgi:cell wall-associated NlpC family hydrolase
MVRIAIAATTAGVATLAAGWVALGSAETEPIKAAKVTSPMVAPVVADESELPPLPEDMRAKVVEPVAGTVTAVPDTSSVADPGLTGTDAKPTREASSTARRDNATSGGSNAIDKAVALPDGVALPPLEAPEAVKKIIEAGNSIARTPYKWGGGHGKWQDTGYDCSGSVSFALAAAGLLSGPLASGPLMSWGKPGKGKWVTIYTNPGHVFLEVAGVRFDTSATRVTGSRWANEGRSTEGFVARHPPGL